METKNSKKKGLFIIAQSLVLCGMLVVAAASGSANNDAFWEGFRDGYNAVTSSTDAVDSLKNQVDSTYISNDYDPSLPLLVDR
jgi:hypothetical protein